MNKAEELLEKMRRNPTGRYEAEDYEKVYMGNGFSKRQGGNHTIYTHKVFQTIWATVKREKPYSPAYARTCVERVDAARVLEAKTKEVKMPEQKQEVNGDEQIKEISRKQNPKNNKKRSRR